MGEKAGNVSIARFFGNIEEKEKRSRFLGNKSKDLPHYDRNSINHEDAYVNDLYLQALPSPPSVRATEKSTLSKKLLRFVDGVSQYPKSRGYLPGGGLVCPLISVFPRLALENALPWTFLVSDGLEVVGGLETMWKCVFILVVFLTQKNNWDFVQMELHRASRFIFQPVTVTKCLKRTINDIPHNKQHELGAMIRAKKAVVFEIC